MRMLSAIPALPVTDMARSVAFYRDVLGMTVGHHDAGFAVLRADGIQIHLWAATDEDWRSRSATDPVVSGAESFIAGTASCQVQVDDVDALHERLKTAGVLHSRGQIADRPWGTRDFSIVDPDNNLITFFERLAPARAKAAPGAEGKSSAPDHAAPDDSADL